MGIRQMLADYSPFNEQEEKDRELMLRYLDQFDDLFRRENEFAHFTASSWVVNRERTKVLMVYHNIYRSWSWIGGHMDGETDFLATAIRETKEETGIEQVTAGIAGTLFARNIECGRACQKRQTGRDTCASEPDLPAGSGRDATDEHQTGRKQRGRLDGVGRGAQQVHRALHEGSFTPS